MARGFNPNPVINALGQLGQSRALLAQRKREERDREEARREKEKQRAAQHRINNWQTGGAVVGGVIGGVFGGAGGAAAGASVGSGVGGMVGGYRENGEVDQQQATNTTIQGLNMYAQNERNVEAQEKQTAIEAARESRNESAYQQKISQEDGYKDWKAKKDIYDNEGANSTFGNNTEREPYPAYVSKDPSLQALSERKTMKYTPTDEYVASLNLATQKKGYTQKTLPDGSTIIIDNKTGLPLANNYKTEPTANSTNYTQTYNQLSQSIVNLKTKSTNQEEGKEPTFERKSDQMKWDRQTAQQKNMKNSSPKNKEGSGYKFIHSNPSEIAQRKKEDIDIYRRIKKEHPTWTPKQVENAYYDKDGSPENISSLVEVARKTRDTSERGRKKLDVNLAEKEINIQYDKLRKSRSYDAPLGEKRFTNDGFKLEDLVTQNTEKEAKRRGKTYDDLSRSEIEEIENAYRKSPEYAKAEAYSRQGITADEKVSIWRKHYKNIANSNAYDQKSRNDAQTKLDENLKRRHRANIGNLTPSAKNSYIAGFKKLGMSPKGMADINRDIKAKFKPKSNRVVAGSSAETGGGVTPDKVEVKESKLLEKTSPKKRLKLGNKVTRSDGTVKEIKKDDHKKLQDVFTRKEYSSKNDPVETIKEKYTNKDGSFDKKSYFAEVDKDKREKLNEFSEFFNNLEYDNAGFWIDKDRGSGDGDESLVYGLKNLEKKRKAR